MFNITIKFVMKSIKIFKNSRIDKETKIESLIKKVYDSFINLLNNSQKNIKIDILNLKDKIENENINLINDKENRYKNKLVFY